MKRIKLFGINGCVSMLAFFLCVSFLSCNNEAEVADVPENFSTDLCKLSDNLCQLIATRNHVTRSDKNSTLCIKAAEFDALLLQFVSKYDITSDLTPAEVNALILTEDEWIELMGNEDAFLSYIANNKTAQFQQMFEKMLSGNTNDININSIVRDKSLKLNEKFILAMQLGVAQDTPIDIDIDDPQVSVCDKRFARAVQSCQIQFATATVGALATSMASGGLGIFAGGLAVVNYFNCINDANNAYEDCLEDHAK